MEFLNKLLKFKDSTFAFKKEYWINESEAYAIYFLLQEHNIDIFMEIGTCNGFSSCVAASAILDNNKVPEVHTWDIESRRKIYEINDFLPLKKYITFHNELFSLKNMNLDKKIAFFVDGDHTSSGVKKDWDNILPFLKKEDIVIFHDVLGYRGILKLMIRLKEEYNVSVLRTKRGIGILSLK